MKNANVFVDVDLTLVDANGKLLDGAQEALQRLRDEGCHLFLWVIDTAWCRRDNIQSVTSLQKIWAKNGSQPDFWAAIWRRKARRLS